MTGISYATFFSPKLVGDVSILVRLYSVVVINLHPDFPLCLPFN